MSDAGSLVWYISYGSNMNSDRFSCYIQGGRPFEATRTYTGCRDGSLPIDSITWSLQGVVVFGGTFYVWDPQGSGAAFYFPSNTNVSFARAWLITSQQFSDVVSQENGQDLGYFDDVLNPILKEDSSSSIIGSGPYNKIVYCGKSQGFPAWTFTTSTSFDKVTLNAPSKSYFNCLALGLAETTGLSLLSAENLLRSYPGASVTNNA